MTAAVHPRHQKRGRLRVGLLILLTMAVAAGVVVLIRGAVSDHGRGVADPGGRRLSSITQLAGRLRPAVATRLTVKTHGFRWDPETCDGQAPGWSPAEVDQTFTGPTTVPLYVAAAMHRTGWRLSPAEPDSATSSEPEPTLRLPSDGYDYQPAGGNPYDEHASLQPYGTHQWDLVVTAAAAVNVSHDC